MTDEQKQALLDEWGDINVNHMEWWDCVYDSFKEDMAAKGIHVSDIMFCGFWSQGDGASFTGYISDNEKFFEQHGLTDAYPWITKLMSVGGEFTVNVERNSNRSYVHENTVSVEVSFTDMFYNVLIERDDDLRRSIIVQWDEQLDVEYSTLAGTATEIVRGYCRDLYRQLEEEYDHLTSDEAVWDAIVANDLDVIEEEEAEEENV